MAIEVHHTRHAVAALLVLLSGSGGCSRQAEEYSPKAAKPAEAVPSKDSALAALAARHAATVIELLYGLELTATKQQKLEGKVVAFRARLVDVVKRPSLDYNVILKPDLSNDALTLTATETQVATLLDGSHQQLDSVLAVARIRTIAPIVLRLEPCHEPHCTEVDIELNSFLTPAWISGELLEIEAEPGPPPPDLGRGQ